ncbi:MAG: YgiQ family radical SAM protein [Deltaproteobacteria bacterium]|nr:YgiQ family radical SAM protein [Deltaproteobacteria bacterium]
MPKRPRKLPRERFLPTTSRQARSDHGWDELDVVIVTGDAYVDHPSFGPVLVARALESRGYRVGVLAQPDWHGADDFRRLGRPRLFFGVSSGNMDSMICGYTSRRRRRSDDSYSPAGRAGLRPDRATILYTQRIREAWPGVPVVLGGIEASLRRLAHYDYWSDSVRGSVLVDSGADILVYGMGEQAAITIAGRLESGEDLSTITDVPGTAVRLDRDQMTAYESCPSREPGDGFAVVLPSVDEVRDSRESFSQMTRMIYEETNPHNARDLVQRHGRSGVLVNAPAPPLATAFLDELYALPFARQPHPGYDDPVPAYDMVRDSITIMRGCYGGCAFCALSLHQGRIVQCRSAGSVLAEVEQICLTPGFKGNISDLGGPTANLYATGCGPREKQETCRRTSCLHPRLCKHLVTDPGPLLDLMRAVREAPGVKRAFVNSGVRMDVALKAPGYIEALAAHHVGGQLSVAPEHAHPDVLKVMRKHPVEVYDRFAQRFAKASMKAGKKQYLVPYLMSGHPGCSLDEMRRARDWLQERNLRPRQVQEFVPAPMTLAASMYHTGHDPVSGRPVHVARSDDEKSEQKSLLLYWK